MVKDTVAGDKVRPDEEWDSTEHSAPGKDIGWQNSTAKTDMVRACVKDGQWTAASKGDALFHNNWAEKSRKTTKEVAREYKARHRHKEHTIWRNDGHGAWQSQMETSNSILIILMKEKEWKKEAYQITNFCYCSRFGSCSSCCLLRNVNKDVGTICETLTCVIFLLFFFDILDYFNCKLAH